MHIALKTWNFSRFLSLISPKLFLLHSSPCLSACMCRCLCDLEHKDRKRDNTDDLNFHYSFIINLIKLVYGMKAATENPIKI